MEVAIFFGVLLVIGGVAIFAKHRHSANWQKVAKRLGLGFEDSTWLGHPRLYGKFRDVDVDVMIETVGHGNQKQVYTEVQAPVSGLAPRGLTVYREGLFQKLGKAIGGEDIQVGDAELDKAFIIKGEDPRAVVELFRHPSLKRALLIGQRRHQTLRVDYPRVRIRARGRTTNTDTLESYIRTVVDLAVSIDEASGARETPAEPAALEPGERFGPPAKASGDDWW